MRGRSSVFLWVLLLLFVWEVAAYLVSPYRDHPSASGVDRNPTPLRGWPEYLKGVASSEGSRLVVLAGTSQGLGLEFADDSRIFPARLRRELRNKSPDTTLENWSIAGLQTDQLELLSMQAVRREASLVVFVLSLGSIEEQRLLRIGRDAADVDLIAGDPWIWSMFPKTVVSQNTTYHDLLIRALKLHSNIGRSRAALLDVAAEYLPASDHRFVFGGHRPRNARLTVAEQLERKGTIQFQSPTSFESQRPPEFYEDQYRRRRLPTFLTLYAGLRERFRDAGIDLIWVWTPLAAKGFENLILKGAAPIQRDICGRIEADGWRCLDATHALTKDHFIVGDIASHLNDKGHEAMARLLGPLLVDALH